jgi:CubicO group peptidase (beta-lactamase class C family)
MKHLNLKLPIVILALFPMLTSCKIARFVGYNFADIKDYKKFPYRTAENSNNDTFRFYTTTRGKAPKETTIDGKKISFNQYLEQNNTVAFLIIKNDTIQYEQYFRGYHRASIIPSFSMAKSVTSILIGCAIKDGHIQSVQEPVTNYLPELKKNGLDKVTIEHLLQMTSGLKFNEGYSNPFGDVATFYYGRNLRKAIRKMKLKTEPGKEFEYLSGNTQLLGLVLERALKNKTVTQYLQEKLWQPLGMEYDATWSLDKKKNGLEKTYCCVNARAVDYAKIGRLYLNKGEWNGRQVVPAEWVEKSTIADKNNGSVDYYQYQWWLPTATGDFMAQGILGQYIYVNPAKNLIIVRLGKSEGKVDWGSLFVNLAQSY